jgi:hypothetical protein
MELWNRGFLILDLPFGSWFQWLRGHILGGRIIGLLQLVRAHLLLETLLFGGIPVEISLKYYSYILSITESIFSWSFS